MSSKVRARKETPVTSTQLTSIYLLGKLPGEGNKEVKLRHIPTEQFNTIIAVVAGSCSHFLCLTENGEVLVCGKGIAGQLGLGIDKRATPTLHPIKFTTQVFIVNITCNFAQCAAITDEGKLYMWGSGHTASWEPKLEESLENIFVSKCSLGGAHALVIGTPLLEPNAKSFIYGFGNNNFGQLCLPEESYEKFSRVSKFLSDSIVYISCGYYHSAIVTDEGKVYFFGTFSPAKKPIKEPISIEPEGHKIISCSCANNQVFLLTEFGKLFRFCDASPASEFTNSIKQVDELFGKYVKHIASDTNFSMALVKSSQRQSEVYVTGTPSKFIFGEKLENSEDSTKFSLCDELAELFILQFACGTCFSIILAGTERLHSHLEEEEPLNTKKHKFEKTPINFPVRCLSCNRFVFGLRHGIWKCVECGCTVHSKCKKSVPNCYGALQAITPPSIEQKKSTVSPVHKSDANGTSIEEQEAQVLMLWAKAQSDFAQDFVKHISEDSIIKEKKPKRRVEEIERVPSVPIKNGENSSVNKIKSEKRRSKSVQITQDISVPEEPIEKPKLPEAEKSKQIALLKNKINLYRKRLKDLEEELNKLVNEDAAPPSSSSDSSTSFPLRSSPSVPNQLSSSQPSSKPKSKSKIPAALQISAPPVSRQENNNPVLISSSTLPYFPTYSSLQPPAPCDVPKSPPAGTHILFPSFPSYEIPRSPPAGHISFPAFPPFSNTLSSSLSISSSGSESSPRSPPATVPITFPAFPTYHTPNNLAIASSSDSSPRSPPANVSISYPVFPTYPNLTTLPTTSPKTSPRTPPATVPITFPVFPTFTNPLPPNLPGDSPIEPELPPPTPPGEFPSDVTMSLPAFPQTPVGLLAPEGGGIILPQDTNLQKTLMATLLSQNAANAQLATQSVPSHSQSPIMSLPQSQGTPNSNLSSSAPSTGLLNGPNPPDSPEKSVLSKKEKQNKIVTPRVASSKPSDHVFIQRSKLVIEKAWTIEPDQVRIERLLGEGASAQVYLGRYRGQGVAIKVMKDKVGNRQLLDFQFELHILREMKSKYNVFFYGACLNPNLCLVMEYCERGSLYSRLNDAYQRFKWPRMLKIALEICRGVSCLHFWEPQIVHRDLKSHNLLIDSNWNVKIADFGLARLNTSTMKKTTLSKLRGTYTYCAPEIYNGQPFTEKSDVFSIGVILWEMVVRVIKGRYERPYSEFPELEYDFQIIVQTARGKRCTIPPTTPPTLTKVIQQCWHSDPNARPTAHELVSILQNLQREYKANEETWNWSILKKD